MSTLPWELPTYIKNKDNENFNEEFFETLRQWFNSDGFYLPTLTNAQEAILMTLNPPLQPFRQWFNSDIGKLRILVAVGVIQTVTSV